MTGEATKKQAAVAEWPPAWTAHSESSPRKLLKRRNGETQIPINLIVARHVALGCVPGIGFKKWGNCLKD